MRNTQPDGQLSKRTFRVEEANKVSLIATRCGEEEDLHGVVREDCGEDGASIPLKTIVVGAGVEGHLIGCDQSNRRHDRRGLNRQAWVVQTVGPSLSPRVAHDVVGSKSVGQNRGVTC